MIDVQKSRLRPRVLALVAALLFLFDVGAHVAFGDPCASPPPPRYEPGQVDHYPNGADIITCTESPPGHEIWKIEYPSVDRSLTDYPAITFNPGDVVTLQAGGCVQTGGSGSTWKRYVNPDDGSGHLDSQYYGTVQIVGVTGDNNPESILHWTGPSVVVPQAGHLALGYVDDGGIGDNGYWNPDNGINNQCVNDSKTTVFITIDRHAAHLADCKKAVGFANTPVAPSVPELERVAELLTDAAEVPVGLPITKDAQGTGIKHFQLFQDGHRGERTTKSNRPLNSAEMHNDGCIYFAFTPTAAPLWYPADLAFDSAPQKNWQARPWDLGHAQVGFSDLEALNRDATKWLSTFLPGYCSGAGNSWRTSAPRWIDVCTPSRVPPGQWTPSNLTNFPLADQPNSEIAQSGAVCDWHIKHEPPFPTDVSTSTWPSGIPYRTGISSTRKESSVTLSFPAAITAVTTTARPMVATWACMLM